MNDEHTHTCMTCGKVIACYDAECRLSAEGRCGSCVTSSLPILPPLGALTRSVA